MSHNTEPVDPGLQPSLHFEHNGSRIYVYNVPEIAAAEPGTTVRLYENGALSGDLRAITLDATVKLSDGGPVLAMELVAQLSPAPENEQTLSWLQESIETERVGRSYTSRDTRYGNVVRLNMGLGVEALACFDDDAQRLTVSNDARFGYSGPDHEPVMAQPVLLGRLDAGLQLMVMSQFMTELLHYGGAPEGAELHIGDRLELPVRADVRKRLGGATLAAALDAEPAVPPTDEAVLATVGRELAASIDEAVRLDEVAGNAELKELLRNVALSFKHADIMAQWGVRRPQGLLLHGEPGTGKTMLIEALANEIGAKLRRVQGSDIYGKWVGESEANIKRIFSELRQATSPTIVFFDELEAVIGINTSQGGDSVRNSVAGIFKQELNDLARQNPNVLVAAASNDLSAIDSSLIRSGRFDHVYEVSLPDAAALSELFASNIARRRLEFETDTFRMFTDDVYEGVPAFAAAAEGLSGADVVEIFRRLCFERAIHQARTGTVLPIARADLLRAIDDF